MEAKPEEQSSKASASTTSRVSLPTAEGDARCLEETLQTPTDTIARLISEGRITPAKANPIPWPDDQPLYTVEQVDAIYAASRGDH